MEKRYKVIKPKHGYFKGECKDADISPTIDTGVGCWHTLIGEVKCEVVGMLTGGGYEKMHEQSCRVYSPDGLAPTMHTCGGGNLEPKICEMKNNSVSKESEYRFFEQAIETLHHNDCEVGDTIDAYNKRVNKDGISPTITTRPDGFKTAILPIVDNNKLIVYDGFNQQIRKDSDTCGTITRNVGADLKRSGQGIVEPQLRVRKLTQHECFKLMGVKTEDYNAIAKNQSKSSLYHLAGDSIVTTCIMALFGELYGIDYEPIIDTLSEVLAGEKNK